MLGKALSPFRAHMSRGHINATCGTTVCKAGMVAEKVRSGYSSIMTEYVKESSKYRLKITLGFQSNFVLISAIYKETRDG